MKVTAFLLFTLIFSSCQKNNKYVSSYNESDIKWNKTKKIKVVNLGTFHFGFTTDENKAEFDEKNIDNQKQAHEIAQRLSEFKPTVILVEQEPSYNLKLQEIYEKYKKNPKMVFNNINEIHLIAFELGRIANTNRIYGIDHQLGYNYSIGEKITENYIDSTTYNFFKKEPFKFSKNKYNNTKKLSLKESLIQVNSDEYLNYLLNVNADILTYVGKENGFQGADEASEFYKRNLRIFSNLNKIPLSDNDRVFILLGATHTAFLRDFISRSPKYENVSIENYLK